MPNKHEIKEDDNGSVDFAETKKGGIAITVYEGDKTKEGEHTRTDITINPDGTGHYSYHNEDKTEKENVDIKIGDDNNSGGCYLTSACLQALKSDFKDDCFELETLRNFRDDYVHSYDPESIRHYYKVAPVIVENISQKNDSQQIFECLYTDLIVPTIELISQGKKHDAYNLYKQYSLQLEQEYIKNRMLQ